MAINTFQQNTPNPTVRTKSNVLATEYPAVDNVVELGSSKVLLQVESLPDPAIAVDYQDNLAREIDKNRYTAFITKLYGPVFIGKPSIILTRPTASLLSVTISPFELFYKSYRIKTIQPHTKTIDISSYGNTFPLSIYIKFTVTKAQEALKLPFSNNLKGANYYRYLPELVVDISDSKTIATTFTEENPSSFDDSYIDSVRVASTRFIAMPNNQFSANLVYDHIALPPDLTALQLLSLLSATVLTKNSIKLKNITFRRTAIFLQANSEIIITNPLGNSIVITNSTNSSSTFSGINLNMF